MSAIDIWSVKARVRLSVLTLACATVCALSALYIYTLITSSLAQADLRSHFISEAVDGYLGHTPDVRPILDEAGLNRLLQSSIRYDPEIYNILIVDAAGRVLASARPWKEEPVVQWSGLRNQDALHQVAAFWREKQAFSLLPEPASGNPGTRVLFSPSVLRSTLQTPLRNLALLAGLALLTAFLMVIGITRLVGNFLEQLGNKIDSIAQGRRDHPDSSSHLGLPEMEELEGKLWWLGRQVEGARSDVSRLRSNVEIMMKQLDEAVLVFGPDGKLQMAGEPAQQLLAKSREQLLGRTVSEVFPEWTGPGAVLSRASSGSRRVREEAVTLDRPNLPPIHLLVTVEPIEYGEGEPAGMLVAFRNADTRQKIRADLDTARRLTAISRITSGVAHEIKNPLNAMMLHLQIAHDKHEKSIDSRPELEIIRSELSRLDRVVKALLDFHNPVEPHLAEYDLRALASDVTALIRPQADALKVKVELEPCDEEAVVSADSDLLRQGLLNVAVNGLEAMGEGGVLRFSIERSGGDYYVSVTDNGPGIPPEIRDRIFNLYFTTKKASTGVGLAMTYRIMLLHNGTISVDSEVGKGACFRLGLPALHSRGASA